MTSENPTQSKNVKTKGLVAGNERFVQGFICYLHIEPARERNPQQIHAIIPNQPLESQNKAHGPQK